MKNVLLINGGKDFGSSKGRLSRTLQGEAKRVLENLGLEITQTHIDEGYEIQTEIQKILKADALIWQMPGWWMGEPWIVKKYIDEVFGSAHNLFYKNDGRSLENPSKNYGKGGLLQGKKYLLSLTWNAPLEAFTDKNEFFGGVGVDGVYLHFHKLHEFVGMSSLPTFICNDVMKNPQVELYLQNYKKHLEKVFA